jgi:hypothetical protein
MPQIQKFFIHKKSNLKLHKLFCPVLHDGGGFVCFAASATKVFVPFAAQKTQHVSKNMLRLKYGNMKYFLLLCAFKKERLSGWVGDGGVCV